MKEDFTPEILNTFLTLVVIARPGQAAKSNITCTRQKVTKLEQS
ncbi:hypothetical protein [Paenibacillus sp. HW567]|nr:hypothetical protein [Paenibacillus sp. HW567]